MRFAPLLLLAACGGHYRTEMVGQGSLGGTIQLADGAYDVALDLQTPRAQVVSWKMMCGGVEIADGSVGEPFEQYREHRIAELKQDKANEKAAAGAVTSLLVGAVAPRAKVGRVTAGVDPDAAGAVAAASIDDHVELPPGDVGAGKLTVRAHLSAAGACTVVVHADDPAVFGTYRITRVHDLDAEAHDRVVVAAAGAVEVRTRIATQLVTLGADGEARERRRLAFEAEADRREHAVRAQAERQRLEAERLVAIRITAEAQQRHELEIAIATQRQIAIDARTRIYGELVLWGADEGLRARREADAELRMRVADEAREREAQVRVTVALRTRTELRGYLVGLGAVERPALIVETPGVVPFVGARWLEGRWIWNNRQWVWVHGGWSDPGRFDDTGGATIVSVGAPTPPVIVERHTPPTVVVTQDVVEMPVVVVTPSVTPTVVVTPSVVVPTIVVHEHPSHPTIVVHPHPTIVVHPQHRQPKKK